MSSSVSSPSSTTTDALFDQSTVSPSSTTTQSTTDSSDSSMDLSPSSIKSKSSKTSPRQRRTFTLKLKRRVVKQVDEMRAKNPKLNINKAMTAMGYKNYYYSRWVKDIKMAENLLETRIVDVSKVPGYVPHEENRQIHSAISAFLQNTPLPSEIRSLNFVTRVFKLGLTLSCVKRQSCLRPSRTNHLLPNEPSQHDSVRRLV